MQLIRISICDNVAFVKSAICYNIYMKTVLLIVFMFLFAVPSLTAAQENPPETASASSSYTRGKVTDISQGSEVNEFMEQSVTLRISEGGKKGALIKTTNIYSQDDVDRKLQKGDEVVLLEEKKTDGTLSYTISDIYRVNNLFYVLIFFFALVLIMAGRKGLGSIIGLGISIAVLLFYIVPQILNGADPLFTSITGALAITFSTIYLAHGVSRQTTVALVGTLLSLILTGIFAVGMASLLRLSGAGSEDAYMLQLSGVDINLQGLLLGGIIIGALGVLDDITTAQAAAIFTLAETNEKLTVRKLIEKGLRIGKEHITSLVNTLVLAYAGASMPLFLFFVINPLGQPWWVILNYPMIMEEIVRTLAGSIGLILAVPITTVLAAFFAKYNLKIS